MLTPVANVHGTAHLHCGTGRFTAIFTTACHLLDGVWNVMAHVQKPDFVFRRNGRVHLNRRGRHFSRLLAAEVCSSAVVMLDTPCSEVVWRVLATHSICQFPLHFPPVRHRVSSHFNWTLPNPSQKNPVHALPYRIFRIQCNIILPNTRGCSCGFPTKTLSFRHATYPAYPIPSSLIWSP